MVKALSNPRVFVLTFWVATMLLSAVLGGLLLGFDTGTLLIWLGMTLLFPALVGAWLLAQGVTGVPTLKGEPPIARKPVRESPRVPRASRRPARAGSSAAR